MPLQCATCQTTSPVTAKFCPECGSGLTRACPSCGHPAPGGRFCMECGAGLAGPAGIPSATLRAGLSATTGPGPANGPANGPVSERRTTTVLFGDLVGFTTLAEARDPEDVRELLSTYFATARTVVGRYGGTIEKFIGDAVMAVWGVPLSHEDDAERAVRAGLDLVAEVTALGASVGAPDLALRVGLVTGPVAVTLGALHEGMVAGDAVNTAARVQAAATPGTVWVDQETRWLTEATVAFSDMGEHLLKGKSEPVRLHRADMVVASAGGAQRVDGLQAPMAGRDAELRQAKELFHATQADGRARLVVVSGIAGIGKSRLGWEFDKYTDGIDDELFWHRGRCPSYGDGGAFWAFAEMVRSRLHLAEGDDASTVEDKVRHGVASVTRNAEEAAWLTPRLLALVTGGGTGSFDRTDLFSAWTTFLERVAGDKPVALLFEDAQHADDGLLDLIEHLLRTTRARLFMMVFTRSELLDRRPGLVRARGATLVELAPLGDDAMAGVVDALVADLPGRARAALVGRAEGVPLYALELVRSLIDQDAVVARDGRHVFVDQAHAVVDLDRLATPTSLQTLIAARLDTLSPLERRTVQDAAVLGSSFGYDSIRALADTSSYELDGALTALVGKGVLEVQGEPLAAEPGAYRFVQAMVRDVAYGTLARADRRARHLAAADHLEREVGEGGGAPAGIVARHLLDALAAGRPGDPDRGRLVARARGLLVMAAARSETLGSADEALRSTLAALDLEPVGLEATQLRERAARVAMLAGKHSLGEGLAAQAVAGYRERDAVEDLVRALALHARLALRLGRAREAGELAGQGHAMLREREVDPERALPLACELLRTMASAARISGDRASQQRYTLEALSLAEELQDPAVLHRALTSLSTMLLDSGSRSGHQAVTERCLVMAREAHLLEPLSDSLINLTSETYAQDLAGASERAEESVSVARQLGNSDATEVALTNACFTWWLNGDWDRLLAETGEWFEDREVTASSGSLWLSRAQVQLARGEAVDVPDIPPSEDPYDQQTAAVSLALRSAWRGEVADAAAALERVQRSLQAVELEDFEMIWAPGVELQLHAGSVAAASRLLQLAEPVAGRRGRPLTRALLPRLRGLVTAARGEDPEADLREAVAALEAYGARYLLARTRLELGRWLVARDRTGEADPLLAEARAVFVDLRALPSVAEVDALERPRAAGRPAPTPSAR